MERDGSRRHLEARTGMGCEPGVGQEFRKLVGWMMSEPVDFGKGTGHNRNDGSEATRWALRSSLARARACRAA